MKRTTILIALLAVLVAWSCSSLDPLVPSDADTGSASFARFHAVGDSYFAGVQNAGLVTGFQMVSVPALLADASQAPEFAIPSVSEPGNPRTLYVASFSPLSIDTLPGPAGLPTNLSYPGIYHNLAIPGANVHDLLVTRPAPGTPFGLVLRDTALFGPTAVDQAVAVRPTLLAVWAGVNDVLQSATVGTHLLLTPAAMFDADYRTMMDRFTGASSAVVAANVPNLLGAPFFATLPPVVVDPATGEPVIIGGNPVPLIGVVRGSPGPLPLNEPILVTLAAAPLMAQGIGIPSALPGGTDTPLPDAVILDADEIAAIVARTLEYNASIDSICANRGVAVVDAAAVFADMQANGVAIHGEGNVLTTDYLTGGLYSVDGIHLSSLGQWVVAREFVRVINARFSAAIPQPRLPFGPVRDPGLGTSSSLVAAASILPAEWAVLWRLLGTDATRLEH